MVFLDGEKCGEYFLSFGFSNLTSGEEKNTCSYLHTNFGRVERNGGYKRHFKLPILSVQVEGFGEKDRNITNLSFLFSPNRALLFSMINSSLWNICKKFY